ncbi:MAG: PDZ domain-containing protein [bacterium]
MNKFKEINKLLLSTALVIIVAINSVSLFADTIFLIHGDTVKGIVTEQYEDRVIIRVPGGEIGIYRNRILRIKFDESEQNYLQLGDKYLEKKQFDKALQLYKRAIKTNPNFQQAKDALLRLKDVKKAHIMEKQKKEELLRKTREESEITLENMLGIKIDNENKMEIYPNSPAAKKGIQAGDKLISIYNQLVRYMSLLNVQKYLIGSGTGEVKLTIERHIRITESDRLGIRIDIKQTGLTITEVVKNSLAERVGLKAGDNIIVINGKNTRYMNMKQVIKNLKQRSAGQLSLVMRRDIVLNRIHVEKTNVSVQTETLQTKKKQEGYLGLRLEGNSTKITSVVKNSPAEKSGLRKGAQIIKIARKSVKNMSYDSFINKLKGPAGEEVELTVERDIPIKMLKIPGTEKKGLGIKIKEIPEGITITHVTEGSAADIAGLKVGDIITAIDKKSLKGMSMSDVIKTLKEKKDVEFTIMVRKEIKIRRGKYNGK